MTTEPEDEPPEPTRYDSTTGERTNAIGDIVPNPLTQSQRHEIRQGREDEWEAFCAANRPDAELSERVKAHVRKLVGL